MKRVRQGPSDARMEDLELFNVNPDAPQRTLGPLGLPPPLSSEARSFVWNQCQYRQESLAAPGFEVPSAWPQRMMASHMLPPNFMGMAQRNAMRHPMQARIRPPLAPIGMQVPLQAPHYGASQAYVPAFDRGAIHNRGDHVMDINEEGLEEIEAVNPARIGFLRRGAKWLKYILMLEMLGWKRPEAHNLPAVTWKSIVAFWVLLVSGVIWTVGGFVCNPKGWSGPTALGAHLVALMIHYFRADTNREKGDLRY